MTLNWPTRLLLTLAVSTPLLMTGCAAPANNSLPPVLNSAPAATPLSAPLAATGSEDSSTFLKRVDDLLPKLEAWQRRVLDSFVSATPK